MIAVVDKTQPSDQHLPWVVFPWEAEKEEAGPGDAVTRLLQYIGEDPTRDGLVDTPKRVIKALGEMTSGYHQDPRKILGRVFEMDTDEMVVLSGIRFTSLCEHHMLPFTGVATIGYIPNGKVVGISKLARVTETFARRLQIQERMTKQIAEAIQETLNPFGVGVVLKAHHECMGCRGVLQPDAKMVTSAMFGAMRNLSETRQEFMSFVE